jgi:hypothetical protein
MVCVNPQSPRGGDPGGAGTVSPPGRAGTEPFRENVTFYLEKISKRLESVVTLLIFMLLFTFFMLFFGR